MKPKFEKTILIDLDGVLNEYKGEFDKDIIPKIKHGGYDFIKHLHQKCYKIKLFTTRNKILASKWVIKYNLDEFIDDITNVKELAWLYIDDRCLTFNGNYAEIYSKIENFKPHYKV